MNTWEYLRRVYNDMFNSIDAIILVNKCKTPNHSQTEYLRLMKRVKDRKGELIKCNSTQIQNV